MENNSIFDILQDVYSSTNVGKVRDENQDSIGFSKSENGDIFVVCDGMGGHAGGQTASSIAVDSIMEYMNTEIYPDIKEAMSNSIKYAHSKIREAADADPKLKGMGTTVVMLVIKEDKAYISHVGDSRIYLLSDNKLYRLTKDESYVQMLIDREVINEEEAETHPRKSELLQAMGTKEKVFPVVAEEAILPKNGDVFLLCSDGLSGMVNDLTIQATIKNTEKSIKERGDELMQLALNAGAKDNVSIHLVNVSGSNYIETKFVDQSNVAILTTTQYDEINEDNTKTLIEEETEKIEEDSQRNNDTIPDIDEVLNTDSNEKEQSLFTKFLQNKYLLGISILIVVATAFMLFQTDDKYKVYFLENELNNEFVFNKEFKDTVEAEKYLKEELNKNQIAGFIQFEEINSDTIKSTIKKTRYTVKEGDTWETIYREYGVCSCFIKINNNKSKTYNPEIGDELVIPVQYSSLEKLNKEKYTDYTEDKVGKSCSKLDKDGNFIKKELEVRNTNNEENNTPDVVTPEVITPEVVKPEDNTPEDNSRQPVPEIQDENKVDTSKTQALPTNSGGKSNDGGGEGNPEGVNNTPPTGKTNDSGGTVPPTDEKKKKENNPK